MRADIFRRWLQNHGCHIQAPERGAGHASLLIQLGKRQSTLPLSHQELPPDIVSQILFDLNLPAQNLPGPHS